MPPPSAMPRISRFDHHLPEPGRCSSSPSATQQKQHEPRHSSAQGKLPRLLSHRGGKTVRTPKQQEAYEYVYQVPSEELLN